VTTAADAEDVNVSMPFHICWNTSHAISCVITREEYTYMPQPAVTAISRGKSLAKYVAKYWGGGANPWMNNMWECDSGGTGSV